jgi:hypothetical protein
VLISVNPVSKKYILKKQTQFRQGQIDVSSYLKECYWNIKPCEAAEKQSQFKASPKRSRMGQFARPAGRMVAKTAWISGDIIHIFCCTFVGIVLL